MSTLDDFVSVTVTTVSQTPSQVGFGTPLVAAYHTLDPVQRVRGYNRLQDAVADGIVSTGVTAAAYAALSAAFSQSPRPAEVKLGRLASAPTQVTVLTPTNATAGTVFRFDFGALGASLTTLTRTVPGSSSIAAECTAIKALIDALSLAVTVTTPGSANVTITTNTPGVLFDVRNWTSSLLLSDTTAVAGTLATDLAAIAAEDNDWYGLGLAYNSKAYVQAAAAWVETAKKLFFYSTSDTACGDNSSTTDVMYLLKASAYFRTGGLYSGVALLGYSGIAWLAEGLPWPPGSSTFALKTLAGVPVDSAVSTTQNGVILGKNGNTYTEVAGENITNPGKSAAGEYLDIAFGRDWLEARMQERVFGTLRSVRKVPYTDTGVDMVVASVKAQLEDGVDATYLAADPAPTVQAPRVADVSPTNRANRLLPDVTFDAHLAGAIQAVQITGRISV